MLPRPFVTNVLASVRRLVGNVSLVVPFASMVVFAGVLSCGHEGPGNVAHADEGKVGAGPSEHALEKPFVYVALGDSTAKGVGAAAGKGYVDRLYARLVEARPGSTLINLSVSGATTADVVRVQLEPMRTAHATIATLGVGVNDLRSGVPLATFSADYERIVTAMVESVDGPVIVQNLPDGSLAPVIPALYRTTVHDKAMSFNERIAAVARLHAVTLVDLFTVSDQVMPGHPELFSSDGFHPSELGYAQWADALWPTVQGAAGI